MRNVLLASLLTLGIGLGHAIATPTLVIDTSGSDKIDYVVVDGTAADLNGTVGVPNNSVGFDTDSDGGINTIPDLAGWALTESDGLRTGGPLNYFLNLRNVSVRSGGAGDLVVAWIVDFASPLLTASGISINANPSQNQGKVEFYVESATAATPSPSAGDDGLTSAGGFLLTPMAGGTSGEIDGTGSWETTLAAPLSPYSLALVAVIHATAKDQLFSFDFSVTGVPEPGFYGLLALALSGLFFFGFRSRNAGAEEASQ